MHGQQNIKNYLYTLQYFSQSSW